MKYTWLCRSRSRTRARSRRSSGPPPYNRSRQSGRLSATIAKARTSWSYDLPGTSLPPALTIRLSMRERGQGVAGRASGMACTDRSSSSSRAHSSRRLVVLATTASRRG